MTFKDAVRQAKENYEKEVQRANEKTQFMQSFVSSLEGLEEVE